MTLVTLTKHIGSCRPISPLEPLALDRFAKSLMDTSVKLTTTCYAKPNLRQVMYFSYAGILFFY